MFTGIVEEAGTVVSLETTPKGCRYVVEAPLCSVGAQLGESIANNGCCLTVVAIEGSRLTFDLLEETRRATNLLGLKPGSRVNLERSLRADARLGGHFVTGHVDGTAAVTRWEREGSDYVLEVEVPAGMERYVVPKGCIAIDGISLTVGKVEGRRFNVWIIPHTYQVTTLQDRQTGDAVNLEYDLLAKYAEKLLLSTNLQT
jgi:riboflavin synthase